MPKAECPSCGKLIWVCEWCDHLSHVKEKEVKGKKYVECFYCGNQEEVENDSA